MRPHQPDLQGKGAEKFKDEIAAMRNVSKGRQVRIVSRARGSKDDGNDQDDRIYAVQVSQ